MEHELFYDTTNNTQIVENNNNTTKFEFFRSSHTLNSSCKTYRDCSSNNINECILYENVNDIKTTQISGFQTPMNRIEENLEKYPNHKMVWSTDDTDAKIL